MRNLLRRDSTARILSLALAVILWFYVYWEENPIASRTVRELPIEVQGLDPAFAVVGIDPASVTVVVEGPAQILHQLGSEDLTATVNLNQATAGPVVAAVRVRAPQPLKVVEISPEQVIVLVEPLVEVTLPVNLTVTGQVAPGFRSLEPHLSPREVTVRGGASLVEQVDRVVTNVDLAGAQQTVQQRLPLYPIDAAGRQVTDVELIPRNVTVEVPVEPLPPLGAKPIEVTLQGQPAEGYAIVGDPVVRPADVVIRAPAEVAGRLERIRTQPVDVGGATESVEVVVGLQLPEGVELVGPAEVEVYVPILPVEAESADPPEDPGSMDAM